MRGQRALEGKPFPSAFNRAPIQCQPSNPTAYCFCGSAEETEGECPWRYDPFATPEERLLQAGDPDEEGFVAPYDCYIKAAEGYTEPRRPESYADYETPGVYGYEFVGEECLFVLHSNSCDRDPSLPCEELGDIRYQFFNYIQHGKVGFGGVSIPMSDPTNGELITANANVAATSIESVGTRALEFFPVLRCQGEKGCAEGEEGADERYFAGENIRDYFGNLGRVEHPIGLAASGTDGYSNDGDDRPGIPANLDAHIEEIVKKLEPKLETLRGKEGRAQIMSDRMRSLAGTPIESRLMSAMGTDGREAMHTVLDMSRMPEHAQSTDEEVLERTSPFRVEDPRALVDAEQRMWEELSAKNIDPPFDVAQRSRYWEYWAEAFRDRPLGEASIRMQQAFLRSIMLHEIGHSVGLRHNFAGSFDRDNYQDGYFKVADAAPLPRITDFDRPSLGGNSDGSVLGEEATNYHAELRRARDFRARVGAANTMTGS
ncbi:MAG: zinc-dependent metalloprotease, partial [Myxococcales bacterium]|nr:zinc-dependent metalloprotease [Myxococcales bacterium]